MKLNDQIISPRAFSLFGVLLILILLCAASHAAECPNHCSEDRIDAYAALNEGAAKGFDRINLAKDLLAYTIQSVGYVCDDEISADYNDLPGGALWHVYCNGGTLQYTVTVTASRMVVYPAHIFVFLPRDAK